MTGKCQILPSPCKPSYGECHFFLFASAGDMLGGETSHRPSYQHDSLVLVVAKSCGLFKAHGRVLMLSQPSVFLDSFLKPKTEDINLIQRRVFVKDFPSASGLVTLRCAEHVASAPFVGHNSARLHITSSPHLFAPPAGSPWL